MQHKVNFLPLLFKLSPVALYVLLQNGVLEFVDFLITPQKGQVCEIDDIQVRLP